MASTDDSIAGILIATYSVCQKICLYRVQITWNPPQWDPSQAKHPNSFPIPTFRFLHCKIDLPSSILNANQGTEDNADQALPFSNSVYSLTRLEIMPGQIDGPAGSTASPWVLGIFSKALHASPEIPDQQGPPSVIVRWNLEPTPQSFHPKFDELASKKNIGQPQVRGPISRTSALANGFSLKWKCGDLRTSIAINILSRSTLSNTGWP